MAAAAVEVIHYEGSFSMHELEIDHPPVLVISTEGSTTGSSDSESFPSSLQLVTKKKRRTTHEKNPLGSTGGIYFNRRKNGRVVPHIIVPKILKSDIRRNYATMFTNVYNSCDLDLMHHYLDTFCCPNTIFHQLCSAAMLAKGKKNHCVTGAEAIGEFWGGSMVSTPDICFKMGDTSVKARSDGTGVVQFQFQLGGSTLIPDDVIQKSMSSMQSISDKPFDSATTTMTTTTTYISSNMGSSSINEDDIELEILGEIANIDSNDLLKQQIDNASFTEMLLEMEIEKENQTLCQLRSNFEAFQIGGPMRAIPFQVRGVASMHLDSDNKIYFLQFDMLD